MIIFPADTAGAGVFPAVQVVPVRAQQTQTVLGLERVRLAGEPGGEVCWTAVEPHQRAALEDSAQPGQTEVGPEKHPE